MPRQRIYITGHNGFLGKHLQERISADTYLYNRNGRVESVSEFKPDYIYHLAGEIYKEDEMVESNILLTHRLLEQARKLPNLKAFIYVGSSSEYGRKEKPMSETDLLEPTNMYEATKGSATLLCQAYAKELPVVIARPFSLYGKYEPSRRFIPTIISSILKRKRKKLMISPGVHDFIHIDDFLDGLFLLAKDPHPGEIYNFGTGVQTSNLELVSIIEELIGKEALKEITGSIHDYDSDSWVANNTKARMLGWKPKYDLVKGLSKVIGETTKCQA